MEDSRKKNGLCFYLSKTNHLNKVAPRSEMFLGCYPHELVRCPTPRQPPGFKAILSLFILWIRFFCCSDMAVLMFDGLNI